MLASIIKKLSFILTQRLSLRHLYHESKGHYVAFMFGGFHLDKKNLISYGHLIK